MSLLSEILDLCKVFSSHIHYYDCSLCKSYKNLSAISLFKVKRYVKPTWWSIEINERKQINLSSILPSSQSSPELGEVIKGYITPSVLTPTVNASESSGTESLYQSYIWQTTSSTLCPHSLQHPQNTHADKKVLKHIRTVCFMSNFQLCFCWSPSLNM